MTASKEAVLISKILQKHSSRPDLRLWRNETAICWVGEYRGKTPKGDVVLRRGASRLQAGLCVGSADLIGLTNAGRFIAIEVKTGTKQQPSKQQRKFLALIEEMGGIAAVVRSVGEVTQLLGEPPK